MRAAFTLLIALALLPVAPAPAGETASPVLAGSMTGEAATALTRRVAAAVERLRGVRFEKPVAVKVVSDAEARRHFQQRITKFWPAEDVRNDQQAYINLGFMPKGTDLMKVLLDLMEEQAGGYYDPESRTFFVLSDMPRSTAAVFVAHELTHALDDQRYGLDGLMERYKDDDDRSLAITAVAEGSATVIMSLFIVEEIQAKRLTPEAFTELQESDAGRAERLRAAPAILQRSLVGPYILGQGFLLRGDPGRIVHFDATDIDHAFQDPPRSSEQILHPEKYWEPAHRDEPRLVPLPDLSRALGKGWRQVGSGTLGELSLAVLTGLGGVDVGAMDSAQAQAWTDAAATGWGGDTYHQYVHGERSVTVLATVWDTPGDAAEFEKAVPEMPRRAVFRRWDTVLVIGGDLGAEPQAIAEAAFLALATGKVERGRAVRGD